MSSFPYQIGLLGNYEPFRVKIEKTLSQKFGELGFQDSDYVILAGEQINDRNRVGPFAAIYFGYEGANESQDHALDSVLEDSVVVLPIVDSLDHYHAQVPVSLRGVNGVARDSNDHEFHRDVGTVLENFRLLRQERRLFISYRRDDSRRIANQLYDILDRRGFDVFLDTLGVPPGKDFQSVLWHRLSDSDVVVLLDTPNFFESRWTEEEFSRANAMNIQILHLLWPGRNIPTGSEFSRHFRLLDNMFSGTSRDAEALLNDDIASQIAIEVESLRARAMSSRQIQLVDSFCDEARRIGLTADVQPSRHILIDGRGKKIVVVPIVGVPTSLRLNDIYDELGQHDSKNGSIWALYDHRGMLKETIDHLEWLNSNLPLHAVGVYDVAPRLKKVANG